MKVSGMALKSDFLAEVFVLWSIGKELVPSPLIPTHIPIRGVKPAVAGFYLFICALTGCNLQCFGVEYDNFWSQYFTKLILMDLGNANKCNIY